MQGRETARGIRNLMLQQTLWHNIRESTLRSTEAGSITGNQILVEACYSLVSSGTERLVISESIAPETAARMRVPYMQGEFEGDFTYGYSLAGTVMQGPRGWPGRRVHLLHPHQRYAIVDCDDACLLPDTLDLQAATLISNMETAVNAVWDAHLAIGDKVAVLGYGIIGTLLCELVSRLPGIELWVIEPAPTRAAEAREAGLIALASTELLPEAVDIAFNTAANGGALQSAIDATGFEGLVIELSWYGDRNSELKLGGSFHYDRKKIIASQVSAIPGHKRQRWDYATRKALVVQLLGTIDTEAILNRVVPFRDSASFFNSLRQKASVERGVLIDYQES